MTTARLLAGASGYSFKEWKGTFYPDEIKPEEMLAWYSGRLPTVEINNTFYRMPKTSVLENWAATTPTDFRFAIKASQRITHTRGSRPRRPSLSVISTGTSPRSAPKRGPGAVPAAAEPEEGPAAPHRVPRACCPPITTRRSNFATRRGSTTTSTRAQRRRRRAVPLRARGQRAAAAGGDRAVGLRPLAPRGIFGRDLQQWARKLEATSWREIYVYFMHEPTAPGYARALMEFAAK